MDRMYTADEMLENDIRSYKGGIMAGLEAALTMMQALDEGIRINDITHEEAWNIIENVLAGKLKEGELFDGINRDMPVLRTDTDGRS